MSPTSDSSVHYPAGLELGLLDSGIHPGDDLYRHVNQKWFDENEIPSDKSRHGAFTVLDEQAEKYLRDIIEHAIATPRSDEERKVGDLYRSFMAEERINAKGVGPLRDRISEMESLVTSHEAAVAWMGQAQRQGVGGLWELFIDSDPGTPSRYVVFVEQAGIALPDESYYREEAFAPIRDAYRNHLVGALARVGWSTPEEAADRILGFETALASHHWDQVRSRDAKATYNPMTWDGWGQLAPAVDLSLWRSAAEVPQEALAEVVVRQPSFVEGIGAVWSATPLETLKDWFAWNLIRAYSPYLDDETVEAHFDFFGRTLSGTPQLRARWKRAIGFVNAAMGEALGKMYVERHFPPAAKQQMDELVGFLMEAYRESIQSLDWMSEETKLRALEKLEKFTPKVGYPDQWRDYSALEVNPDDLLANLEAASSFEMARELRKIGQPIDRTEWLMTPQTVNAYYHPGMNEIVFPAAILQYPFFDPERDQAANYGSIGAVIGHEIGHGFDDQGSRYDGDGRLADWWSEDDRSRFEERTAALIDQYNALEPLQLPGETVNGALTIGENIGDLGGLAIAWKAYRLSLGGEEPPVIDGLTGAQRFFISWAHSWRLLVRDEEARRLLQIDPHSPPEFRCNQIVRNLDEFYEAFGVTEENALWLSPEERVSIW